MIEWPARAQPQQPCCDAWFASVTAPPVPPAPRIVPSKSLLERACTSITPWRAGLPPGPPSMPDMARQILPNGTVVLVFRANACPPYNRGEQLGAQRFYLASWVRNATQRGCQRTHPVALRHPAAHPCPGGNVQPHSRGNKWVHCVLTRTPRHHRSDGPGGGRGVTIAFAQVWRSLPTSWRSTPRTRTRSLVPLSRASPPTTRTPSSGRPV